GVDPFGDRQLRPLVAGAAFATEGPGTAACAATRASLAASSLAFTKQKSDELFDAGTFGITLAGDRTVLGTLAENESPAGEHMGIGLRDSGQVTAPIVP